MIFVEILLPACLDRPDMPLGEILCYAVHDVGLLMLQDVACSVIH